MTASGDPDPLRHGMLEQLRLSPQPEALVTPEYWDCPYCGKSAPVGSRNYAHCNSTPGMANLQTREFLA